MAEAVVEFVNVVVRYRNKKVLGPLSLHVHPGDFWGVVGPNGAGKSTLLKTLSGLQTLSEGYINVYGEPLDSRLHRRGPTLRKQIGILLQHHDFFPDLPFNVEDVVLFGRTVFPSLGRRYRPTDWKTVDNTIADLDLSHLRNRLYRELSGGEKRKVQLARLVAQEADILLLDEPTAGLDLDWQERLTQLVEDLYRRLGKTIIMVTHDVDHLPSCCNRVLLLNNGDVQAVGTPAEVFQKNILSRLYGCTIEVAEHKGRYHAYSLGIKE